MGAARGARLPAQMQRRLLELYAIEPIADVRRFLTTDRAWVAALEGGRHRPATEKLLIAQQPGTLSVSLYLDARMLARLARRGGLDAVTHRSVADFWDVAEGVSHFTFLAWSAAHDRRVSALEMELQAEVDKFVLASLAVRAERPAHVFLPLHRLQFDHAELDPRLDRDEHERYATAHRYARRYCGRLAAMGEEEMRNELRRFYRLPRAEKFRRIEFLN